MLASAIGGEVTTGRNEAMSSWVLSQARHRQLMTEPQPTLAGYGEVLVLQQDGCSLSSR